MGLCCRNGDDAPEGTAPDRQQPATKGMDSSKAEPKIELDKTSIERLSISLDVAPRLADALPINTVDTPLPPVFYVIVGRGPASVIDHATLIETDFGKKRLKDSPAGTLPILHLGFGNPWASYMQHGMGQPPYLLSMPGFKDEYQPSKINATVDGGLDSREFAKCIDDQFKHLCTADKDRLEKAHYNRMDDIKLLEWPYLPAWVAWIQSSDKEPLSGDYEKRIQEELTGPEFLKEVKAKLNDDYPKYKEKVAPFRLLTVRRTDQKKWRLEFIYAQYIDICTGSGRPNAPEESTTIAKGSDLYKSIRTPPWLNPSDWPELLGERRVTTGMDAIFSVVKWKAGERVCIPKGGGIALNGAEKASKSQCKLEWFSDTNLLASFQNPRNCTFLKRAGADAHRDVGEGQPLVETDLIAYDKLARMGRDAVPLSVSEGAQVSVRLQPRPKGINRNTKKEVPQGTPSIRDYLGNESDLTGDGCWNHKGRYTKPSEKYDRLVLPYGLEPEDIGQPATYASSFRHDNYILGEGGRMLALATGDKTIRLLGASAQTYKAVALATYDEKNPGWTPKDKMWTIRRGLPASAVPDGFILSGLNIALANEYFTADKKNRNVNTMTPDEILAALKDAKVPEPEKAQKAIVDERYASNGYASSPDLVKKANAKGGLADVLLQFPGLGASDREGQLAVALDKALLYTY